MGAIEVKYFNSFILRKTLNTAGSAPEWGGSYGDGTIATQNLPPNVKNWAIEESRIRGGYNNTSVQLGVKAYLVENEPNGSIRSNSMIYSGIFNSRTGVNDTNVFSVGEDITKSANPANGSIQRIFAENTNLTIFQESKVSRALIDKDAIYSAEGGGTITSSNLVIGTIQPYSGNFGISRNPESFASYGYRKYFTDKDRNSVLRLSKDGITEISNYGMSDFFRDELSSLDGVVDSKLKAGKAVGSWDIHNKQYVISLQPASANSTFKTLAFDDAINGFPSLFSYKPDNMISIKNKFFSVNNGILYQHYSSSSKKANYYGVQYKSSITFVFNPQVSASKVFKTINYEGSNGWQVDSFICDVTGVNSVGTPQGSPQNPYALGTQDTTASTSRPGTYSYNQGSYDNYQNEWDATSPGNLIPPLNHAGFNRKENKYMANLINTSTVAAGEILFGQAMTGVKGYFATVTMSTDEDLANGATGTDVGGTKELFAASSNYVESSY